MVQNMSGNMTPSFSTSTQWGTSVRRPRPQLAEQADRGMCSHFKYLWSPGGVACTVTEWLLVAWVLLLLLSLLRPESLPVADGVESLWYAKETSGTVPTATSRSCVNLIIINR